MLLIHVDDIFMIGMDGLIADMKRKLVAKFKMKDLGMMHYFLGMEHYYISIQNPTEKSDGAWISFFKLTKNHKDKFFFCKCGHKRRLSDG